MSGFLMPALVALVACAAPPERPWSGPVVSVADGDTITVRRGAARVIVRIHGIDCPEGTQAFGRQARGMTRAWAMDREARIEPVDTDRYGRTVARVVIRGADLGERLVKAGAAWAFVEYSRRYVGAEKSARNARAGLWAARTPPLPPWEYREQPPAPAARSLAPATAAKPGASRRKAWATCHGNDPCDACTTCARCRHCKKDGGTCGACK